MNQKKPLFRRSEGFRYKKLGKKWRKPRGRHNKLRTKLGGKGNSPAIGYGTKREVRGLHPSGYEDTLIATPSDLDNLNAKKQAVRISAKVGKRKKAMILERAKKLKLKVLNP